MLSKKWNPTTKTLERTTERFKCHLIIYSVIFFSMSMLTSLLPATSRQVFPRVTWCLKAPRRQDGGAAPCVNSRWSEWQLMFAPGRLSLTFSSGFHHESWACGVWMSIISWIQFDKCHVFLIGCLFAFVHRPLVENLSILSRREDKMCRLQHRS